MITSVHRAFVAGVVVVICLGFSRPASAYSALAHQAMVDALWRSTLTPLLHQRFPAASADQLHAAKAFAYGGSVIQDLGYYPFGSKLFTNLVHYVRSGDFVAALIRDARDVNEYAFALGALAHYASDNAGHPLGVNRSVPIVYPKLRAKFGNEVLYAESPARHVMVEFAFDVLQVGLGRYTAQAYRDMIGFEVAAPLLARAFRDTYGLELDALFTNQELAIGTYRHAVSTMIPEMTRLAWEDKQDEIRERLPGIERNRFVFSLTRREYEQAYGTTYKKPGLLSRIIYAIARVIPKVGPLRPLAFEPLTPEATRLMEASYAAAREQYRALLRQIETPAASGRATAAVRNTDLDTGTAPAREYNPLVEETYAELVNKLAERRFTGVSRALLEDLRHHYGATVTGRTLTSKERKLEEKARRKLEPIMVARSQ